MIKHAENEFQYVHLLGIFFLKIVGVFLGVLVFLRYFDRTAGVGGFGSSTQETRYTDLGVFVRNLRRSEEGDEVGDGDVGVG